MKMKKNLKKQQAEGSNMKYKKILNVSLIFTIIYFLWTLLFYLKHQFYPDSLHAINKPFLLYIIKWTYASIIIIALLNISKKSIYSWIAINSTSIAIILLAIIYYITGIYYSSLIDYFLLELIALMLMIITNTINFVNTYKIKRKISYLIYIIFIPIVFTFSIYELLIYIIDNCVW